MTYVQLVAGLIILTAGAELLVRGAVKLAIACSISPLVVGLTIVAFGTSAPELVVSLQSSLIGEPEVALGNVIGSNIANVLLILGLSAILIPLSVSQQLVRLDLPIMVGVSLIVGVMAWSGSISRLEGMVLFAGLILYNIWVIRKSRSEQKAIEQQYSEEFGSATAVVTSKVQILLQVLLVIAGLILLVGGARLFLDSAIGIARSMGVSELVIGLTLVAVGTSLPEVATSLVAAWKGERDLAVGNVIGSNLFNLLGVLGLTAAVTPGGVPVPDAALQLDIPVMIAVAAICIPVFFNGHEVARWEGVTFLFYYAAYFVELGLSSQESPLITPFRKLVFRVAIPLTVLAFVVAFRRASVRKRAAGVNAEKSESKQPSAEQSEESDRPV